MSDMLAVIEPKSDQFNADSLIGGEMTVRIASVAVSAGADQPVTVRLEGQDKVFRPCKTVARIMVAAWGPDSASYVGRSMTLYRDGEVTWGGMKVGGIRVRAMSHIDKPLVIALTEKKGSKKVATIRPLVADVAPIALTLDAARALIVEAPDMAALEQAWRRKDMAPFRADLKSCLDDRKAALAFVPEGRPDEDHGSPDTDAHPGAALADDLVDSYGRATVIGDVLIADGDMATHGDAMLDADRARVAEAKAGADKRFGR